MHTGAEIGYESKLCNKFKSINFLKKNGSAVVLKFSCFNFESSIGNKFNYIRYTSK